MRTERLISEIVKKRRPKVHSPVSSNFLFHIFHLFLNECVAKHTAEATSQRVEDYNGTEESGKA